MKWSKKLVAILQCQTKLRSVLHTLAWRVTYKTYKSLKFYFYELRVILKTSEFNHFGSRVWEFPADRWSSAWTTVEMTQAVYEGASFVTRPLWLKESERPSGECFREETNRKMGTAGWIDEWMGTWKAGRQEGRMAFIFRFANFYTSLCISYILC